MKELSKKFNPYRNEKCFNYALENIEDFEDNIIKQEIRQWEEYYHVSLNDEIQFNLTSDNKALNWVERNYQDLEFVFEYNPSWYCDNDKIGTCQQFSGSWAQEDIDFNGIFVMTLNGPNEIEIRLDDGSYSYISMDGYFKVLARIA